MDIKFSITLDNYIDFNLYHMEHSKSMKKVFIMLKYILPLVFVICGCALYYLLSNGENISGYFYILLCGIVYNLIFSKIYKKEIRKGIVKLVNEGKSD